MKHRLLLSFAALILSVNLSQTAFADSVITLSLSNPNQSTIPDVNVSYSATVTNTSASTVNLDQIGFIFGSFSSFDPTVNTPPSCPGIAAPCLDDTPFLSNFPLTLGANASFTGILFNAIVPSSSARSTFSGAVDMIGDTGGDDPQPLTSNFVSFSTTVTPEPSSWLLLATGLTGLAIACRLRSRSSQAMTSFKRLSV